VLRIIVLRLILMQADLFTGSAADDTEWMQKTIELARSKGTKPSDTPIAAIIVLDGQVIGAEVNQTASNHDATAHAEIMAFRAAGYIHGDADLRGATLYSTLQPCGMCPIASLWAKVSRIVYGAGRSDVHKMYFEDKNLSTMDFISDAYRDDLELVGGVCREECAALYYSPDDDVPAEDQGNI
jgi:tRNA(adenine34) deaminase